MQTQTEFLTAHGVTDQTPHGEVQRLKALHRQNYKREWGKAFAQRHLSIRSSYTQKEHSQVKRAAASHGKMKWAAFQKAATLAYINKSYVVPNKDVLHSLQIGIRRIGNNVNQVAHRVNAVGETGWEDVVRVNAYLDDLENLITKTLCHPPDLAALIASDLDANPGHLKKYRALLDTYNRRE